MKMKLNKGVQIYFAELYSICEIHSIQGRFSYDMTDEFFGPNSERSNKLAQFVGTTMQRLFNAYIKF